MSKLRRHLYRRGGRVAVAVVLCCSILALAGPNGARAATNYAPIAGAGSTWSQNAISQWITDVHQFGMRVNYAGTGSSDGRQEFLNGTVDFAASDIPFQTHPEDGSAPEHPAAGSYAYIPVTAGGTTFMYNLVINGRRVTNLRLSGVNLAKIFTGGITNWNDPAIRADNPGLTMPNRRIVPVVRSDGSGSTAQLSLWLINQYPSLWRAYCARTGRGSACGETSYYPTVPGMVAQSGDLGVAGYISQNYAQGAIGYVQYSYALNSGFPVALMLNRSGYYTEPTPQNVAVSLLQARVDTTDVNDPSKYLTQDLSGVYSDPDPRTYPLSSYSYMILPTRVQGQFTTSKGVTLGAYTYYAMCQGQQESASLGYSPMPINLVQDSFNQIRKIPGVVVQNINIRSCNNPTFSPSGINLLAQTAPFPPACDKQGPTQCSAGTGGARSVSTPVSTGGSGSGSGSGSGTGSSAAATSAGASGSSAAGPRTAGVTAAGAAATRVGRTGSTAANATTACDPATQDCGAAASGADASSGQPVAISATLPPDRGWTTTQTLMLLAILLLLALIVVPGLVARSLKRNSE
jgi:phosphate ABC transporter phosphate-binding protein